MRRFAGLLCLLAGLSLISRALAVASGSAQMNLLGGLDLPSIGPGALLMIVGTVIFYRNRPSLDQPPEPIDIRPLVEWVRAFELHQAERELHRLTQMQQTLPSRGLAMLAPKQPKKADSRPFTKRAAV